LALLERQLLFSASNYLQHWQASFFTEKLQANSFRIPARADCKFREETFGDGGLAGKITGASQGGAIVRDPFMAERPLTGSGQVVKCA